MTEAVDIQGEPLAVRVYVPTRRRGDALMIHGWTGSKEDFAEIGPLLSGLGYRVVTFDDRGQHELAHSQREGAYTIPSLARDAIALADHFGLERPHLLGHSLGGLVAQRAAVMTPSRWASLTVFCSGPRGLPDGERPAACIRSLATHSMRDAWEMDWAEEARSDPRYELLKRRWMMSDPRSIVTHAKHLLTEPSIVREVRATGVPAHVIYGENDDTWPIAMQDQMARDLGAPVTVIANAGHCPNQDRPEHTAAVIANFWGQHDSA